MRGVDLSQSVNHLTISVNLIISWLYLMYVQLLAMDMSVSMCKEARGQP